MSQLVDLVGKSIGRYRVESLLGEGGMGAVYKAHDPTLERGVALKILPPEVVGSQDRLNRFIQEAKAASGLNHPNVVTIYEVGHDEVEAGGTKHAIHFISMELIDGKTLRALLGSGELDLKRALKILAEVADGLRTAHEAGIVHRDVKPENIMLGASGHAKILDFGLAKLKGGLQEGKPSDSSVTAVKATDPGAVMGTVGYMSPEQAQGKAVDPRSDIFTLGCILYEVATGRQPFAGNSHIDTLHKIIYEKPESLEKLVPNAPLELQWILRKALAKDPDDRYQTIRDLAIDLQSLIQDIDSNPSLVSVSGRIDSLQSQGARRVGPALLIVVAISLVAITGLIWQLMRSGSPAEPPAPPPAISARMVTASGKVIAAAISPDGKYVAYVESWQGEQSLWIRQLSDPQSLELIPARPVFYWGVTFAKKGDSIIYGVKSNDDLDGAFYRISPLGGASTHLVDGIDSVPTFSPDGKRMAWLRARYPDANTSAIVVANIDGTEERVLATRSDPEIVAPIYHTACSWSPDGKRIATSVMNIDESRARILIVDADTGAVERTLDEGWPWSGAVAWLPEGDALLAIADESGDVNGVAEVRPQVWLAPYPDGAPRRLTNDFLRYRILSLTADGNSLLTVGSDATCDIFTTADGPRGTARKISSSVLDGYSGASFTSDGRIVYSGLANGRIDIWIMNYDGSSRRQLTNDADENRAPRSAGDGVVYLSIAANQLEVRWVGLEGGPSRLIAPTNDLIVPEISPDGSWVIYRKTDEGIGSLWKVPVTGGSPTRLTDVDSFLPAVSPDGTKIAFYWVDPKTRKYRIGIIPFEGGAMLENFETYVIHAASNLRWTADGNALLINSVESDRANLWLQPLDGSPPTQLTQFDDLLLRGFDCSPDGKIWLLARGRLTRDAVLVTGFR